MIQAEYNIDPLKPGSLDFVRNAIQGVVNRLGTGADTLPNISDKLSEFIQLQQNLYQYIHWWYVHILRNTTAPKAFGKKIFRPDEKPIWEWNGGILDLLIVKGTIVHETETKKRRLKGTTDMDGTKRRRSFKKVRGIRDRSIKDERG